MHVINLNISAEPFALLFGGGFRVFSAGGGVGFEPERELASALDVVEQRFVGAGVGLGFVRVVGGSSAGPACASDTTDRHCPSAGPGCLGG